MRRLATSQLFSFAPLRTGATLASLVKAQDACRGGGKVDKTSLAALQHFLNIRPTAGASAEKSVRAVVANVMMESKSEETCDALRQQTMEERKRDVYSIFLVGVNTRTNKCVLFSVLDDTVVAEVGANVNSWELADQLMAYTKGIPQCIFIPIVDDIKVREQVKKVMEPFMDALRGNGLMPVSHVDTMELAECLSARPPSMKEAMKFVRRGGASSSSAAYSQSWFADHWMYLRTLACKASDDDPLRTLTTYVSPQYHVMVVHLVRAGSRGMNISIWDVHRHRRFVAKGMLSDILACLFSIQSPRMILVPTYRTDRPLLFRCNAALMKAGHRCSIVFPSELRSEYRQAFHSDPCRYWGELKELTKSLDADLIFSTQMAAGGKIREYQKKHLRANPALRSTTKDASNTDADADEALASPSAVEKWAAQFSNPKRLRAEKKEKEMYTKYLVVAFSATDHPAYGRPNNPTATINHIVSVAFTDFSGNTLEPWVMFSSREELHLPSLDAYDVLVVHDAKHFLLFVWDSKELQAFFRRGGRVWCTMLAEYLIDAQRCRTGKNALHDVGLRYGCSLPMNKVIGSTQESLPLSFHRNYLLAAATATMQVFSAQVRKSHEQCQLVSVAHRMDSLLAMTSMEFSGIHVDAEVAQSESRALKHASSVLDNLLDAYVPPELPVDLRHYFDWGSLPQLHAFFFGGRITVGQGFTTRESPTWTSNLVHFCHRFGSLDLMGGELHVQRYAAQAGISTSGNMVQKVVQHLNKTGDAANKRFRMILFDVETTGLNTTTDEIIEIGLFDPVENTTFTTLVNPQRRITPRTINIHHITNELVKDAPTMAVVAQSIAKYLRVGPYDESGGNDVVVLVGHNVFGLDEPMLRRALELHVPEVDHNSMLFCDSVVMLRALMMEMKGAKGAKKRAGQALLETLTSSLRLNALVEKLRLSSEGEMHRADTDAKALWFVLIAAFNLKGKTAAEQCAGLCHAAAKTLVAFPGAGAFVAPFRKRASTEVILPGVAHSLISSPKLVRSLQAKAISEEVLQSMYVRGVKVAGLLLQRQRLDQQTARFLQSSDGELGAIHEDGAVHQLIDMTSTTTSRTASSYPSCQNIPKDDKSSVRRLFTSRYGSKGRCIEVDYSQLEIVVLAILCGDAHLIKDLNAGVDFHVKRAEFFSGLPYAEIYSGYKKGVPKYVALRRTAKQFSFQRLYGAGTSLLHKTTQIPIKDLEKSIQAENEEYPSIAHFHQVTRAVALRPNNPGLPTHFMVEMPTGVRMCFRTRDVILNLPPLKNYPIQGYGAELAQMMVGRLFRRFVETNFYKKKAHLINFVHDSVWIDCHVDVLQLCVRDTTEILCNVHRYVPKAFPGVEIPVPLNVSAACGIDMCSMECIDDGDFTRVAHQHRSPSSEKLHNIVDGLISKEDGGHTVEEEVEEVSSDAGATEEEEEADGEHIVVV